jgi:hypothetical protein
LVELSIRIKPLGEDDVCQVSGNHRVGLDNR